MPYVVYLLECRDGSLYTGITTDLARRFREHQAGRAAAYTRAHPVLKIVYSERSPNRAAALRREAAIKKLSRKKKLELSTGNSSAPPPATPQPAPPQFQSIRRV